MHYYQPGFASASRNRREFVPTDEQVEVAMRRILATLEKFHGVLDAMNDKGAIASLEELVHNRDHQLGDRTKGHFRKVLKAAWERLKALKQVVFDPERCQFVLGYRFDQPRVHRQKYPRGRLAYAR